MTRSRARRRAALERLIGLIEDNDKADPRWRIPTLAKLHQLLDSTAAATPEEDRHVLSRTGPPTSQT